MRHVYALPLGLILTLSVGAWATPTDAPIPSGRAWGAPAGGAIEWIKIEGGAFQMGSLTGRADEQPVHAVTLAAYELSKTEVTVAQYRACVEEKACRG